ncbi:MAG: HAD family phosphatase [Bifidobacteriaceae bacterium]|jgi:beta-phosphoglucomutase-like phosphatase (HAD superfamily)|nr:HAD family phosphatase [Bifidobacteriaceae bacterium]
MINIYNKFFDAKHLPKGAIFDLDGTLVDTEKVVFEMWPKAAKQLGVEVSDEAMLAVVGKNENLSRDILHKMYGESYPYDESLEVLIEMIYTEYAETGVPEKPGLHELFAFFKNLGLKMGVASSSDIKLLEWKLERSDFAEYFHSVTAGDEVEHSKPHPDIFLTELDKLGLKADEVVGFEDAPAGVEALIAAKIPAVFVKDLLDIPKDLKQLLFAEVSTLDEAIQLFN